ncbi:tRNA:m(4)X modification enzyme TRM13 homolog isoform X2 [Capsicum annuum]|uniref:tRNA:m(4)X modification enzyme TRM13 homolog isoform X2 n=1 Tax=Capsicum annuum TaxID=4072 RepID=UPI001FB195B8|nr:tRNA:m(4)X modification enzyme TRM13 homolog isoform X2 [Capsicum annuum]XP_047254326.1 tRNA:m(4)X modification enzyme TRM13 homolog isoform X2 [Capsicum annuum]
MDSLPYPPFPTCCRWEVASTCCTKGGLDIMVIIKFKSSSVLEENLQSHLKRCPFFKQAQSLSLQPFYQEGINAGKEEEEEGVQNFSSEMKRNAVRAMTLFEFSQLINKIKSVHASICNDIRDSFKIPQACDIWTNRQVDRCSIIVLFCMCYVHIMFPLVNSHLIFQSRFVFSCRGLPFQQKHVMQQASILGNLEEFGVLKSCEDNVVSGSVKSDTSVDKDDVPAVVEFGAGRGYLTQVLADCYRIKKILLVERKSYKLKADRSLRQKENVTLERLRIDIEDLKLNAVESLQGVPYLATGKHLCGPATDMTLRCCISKQCNQHNDASSESTCHLIGLAIATCCHHLCQWKHYINKRYMLDLGIGKDDFNAITWFTSWAVDADHGSDLCGTGWSSDLQIRYIFLSVEIIKREKEHVESDLNTYDEVKDMVKNMKAVDRAIIGFMCKDIIDFGRFRWLKEHEFESQLVKYVPSNISPENRLLVARQKC